MHIILVSDRLATAKTITLTGRHLAAAAALLAVVVLGLSTLFSYVTVRHAAEIRLPFLQDMVRAISLDEAQKSKEFLRENINLMAARLGQMQAQLIRLDSLGERLSALSGVKVDGHEAPRGKDGRGGPLVLPNYNSTEDLNKALDALSRQVEAKTDILSALEDQLIEDRIRKNLLPTSLPVPGVAMNASGFGWRVDPFTGDAAMHEGLDFTAEQGTPIHAAAAGVVVNIERHPQYGIMLDIDHGNDLITRYAHVSKTHVKQGALVKRGQKIAEVGSTGRSSGPHLHFEVRVRGVAQNPSRFLQTAQAHNHSKTRHR